MPKLLIITKGKPREIEVGQELTIGRGYSNLLRLEGEEISRVHAIIYRRNHDFILRDLDSKNGVFVNGNRVVTATLDPGDRLQVGKYNMVFNPPPEFSVEGIADQEQTGSNGSEQTFDISDDNLSRSQVFSGTSPDDSIPTGESRLRTDIIREEVLLFTRPELDQRLASDKDISTEKAADYLEEFFDTFLNREPAAHGAVNAGFVSRALISAVKAVSSDRGVVVLRDGKTNTLRPGAIVPEKGDVAVNRVVLQSAFAEGKAIICPATADCGLFREGNTVKRDRISTLISIPLGRIDTIGLLYIDRQGEDAESFNLAHLLAMAKIGRLMELHLEEAYNATQSPLP